MSWCGFKTKVFNVGNRRRVFSTDEQNHKPSGRLERISQISSLQSNTSASQLRSIPRIDPASPDVQAVPGPAVHDAAFFDPFNANAAFLRDRLALDTLQEAISWLKGGGKVAIHDATNTTVQRRQTLAKQVEKEIGIKSLFIESVCTDQALLEQNILMKLEGPDYKCMDRDIAIADFKQRIANYEKVYEPIEEKEEELGVR